MNRSNERSWVLVVALVIAMAGSAKGADGSWAGGTSGIWTNTARWVNGIVADGAGSTAYFTNSLVGALTITINTAQTNGIINAGDPSGNNAVDFIPAGGGTLTFDNGAATAQFNKPKGANQTFGVPVVLASPLAISNAVNRAVTFTNGITGTGSLTLIDGAGGGITISTVPVNMIGTITNSGPGYGTVTLSGGIGANVPAIVQASTNSPLTISTVPLTVNSGGPLLVNNGKKLFTVSGNVGGTGDLVVSNNATDTANAFTISGTVSNFGMLVNSSGSGTGTVTISAAISNNVTKVIQNSTGSVLVLSAANTFTNGLWIKAGTVSAITSVNSVGANTNLITLGDSTGSANTRLRNTAGTLPQPIVVASGNTGIATLDAGQYHFSGPVTLNNHDLTFASDFLANGSQLQGGITGTGTITINHYASSASGYTFGITTLPANHSGKIINVGSGPALATVSGGVGSNVTAIIENSTNSALTVGAIGSLTVNSGGTTLANLNSSGTKVLTVSANVGGTGDLILSNNSAIANGITISSTVTNIGRVVNAGTGSGDVLVSGSIRGVTGVLQDSAFSRLVLSGANTFTGLTAVVSGRLRLDGSVSNVTVSSGGILQGNGMVWNTVTLNNGGTVSPGLDTAAGGTLTNGTLVWNGGGIYTCQVANLSGAAGIDYDQIVVTGSMTAASGVIISLDSLGQTLAFNTNLNYSLKVITCGTAATLDPATVTLKTNACLGISGSWSVTNLNKSIYVYYQPANAGNMNYWIGPTNGSLWSVAANWSKGAVPQPGEDVVFDWHSVSNCTVDVASNNLGSLTLDSSYAGTVTVATVYPDKGAFTDFSMTNCTINGGVLTHTANSGGETNRLSMTVAGNLIVANGGTIGADACGYANANGPGYKGDSYGSAHGGAGIASDWALVNTNVYGSVSAPTNLGSGGQASSYDTHGGGAIMLTVQGTTTVASAGLITANGARIGASGGSVFLSTGWLMGTGGTIRANGSYEYSGGGGRVAIVLTGASADFTSWSGTNAAFGAAGLANSGPSAAGTVYCKTAAGVDWLIVDNNNQTPPAENGGTFYSKPYGQVATLLPGVNLNSFSNVVVRNNGVLGVTGGTTLDFGTFALATNGPGSNPGSYGQTSSYIAIDNDANVTYPTDWTINGYTLFPMGLTKTLTHVTVGVNGALSHYRNYTSETYRLNLTISGNLTVLSNGTIQADGRGYRYGNKGPGAGATAAFGGAYGGETCSNVTGVANSNTYGSVIAPTNTGSSGEHGNGGGAILLNVGSTTTVAAAGTISANGGGHNYASTGSGGSIYLRTGWLTGGGAIRANGTDSGIAGAGGGGRVAIVLTGANATFAPWTGSNTAYGGSISTAARAGSAGTVYRQEAGLAAGAGTVIVDNGGSAVTNATFTSLPALLNKTEDLRLTSWMVTNRTRLGLTTNLTLASLNLSTTNCTLVLNGWTLTTKALTVTNKVYKSGEYTPANISLLTDSVGGGKVVVTGEGTVLILR